ncbi:MAG: alpha/beta fold hydrolase [Streptosporangiaceae bacterium]
MPTVQLAGGISFFEDRGDGDALVLLHGHPFDRTMWRPQLEFCRELGWRVIAPDLRGYGASAAAAGEIHFEQFALDIAALLDKLGIERIVLGGLSMGGQIAMEFFRMFPERVRGLILADTSARADTPEVKRTRHTVADRVLADGMTAYAQELLPKMIAPATIAGRPDIAKHVLSMMRGASPDGAAAALRGRADRTDYLDLLERIEFPVLVVVGKDDSLTPLADAEQMFDRITNANLLLVGNAAHMPNLEQPGLFNAGLVGFLSKFRPLSQR